MTKSQCNAAEDSMIRLARPCSQQSPGRWCESGDCFVCGIECARLGRQAPPPALPAGYGMDDSDEYYEALRDMTATLRLQLRQMALDDPGHLGIYQDLLWCYQERTALLWRRIIACQTAFGHEPLSPPANITLPSTL